jgi:nitrate/nitrite transport system substrate-binding protein
MVANMKVGKMDGFCVGEPWNARAIADGIGFTAVTTQELWPDHPEKVLAFTEEFAAKHPRTVKAVMRAVIEASRWADKLENRAKLAEVVSRPQYINTTREAILGRLLGEYDLGDGRRRKDPLYMTFFDRDTTFPLRSHGTWWLTQFRRWGMVKGPPDYAGLAGRVHRPDLYREVAKELGIAAPKEDARAERFGDGTVFDPSDPEKYARSFAVNALA